MDIKLPRTSTSLEANDLDEIEHVLEDELVDYATELADDFLESGGGSDDEQVEVGEVAVTDEGLRATLHVSCTEVIPSSCGGISHNVRRGGMAELRLPKGTSIATVESLSRTYDLSDRNSAADGT